MKFYLLGGSSLTSEDDPSSEESPDSAPEVMDPQLELELEEEEEGRASDSAKPQVVADGRRER